eukprot:CAMPEP_0173202930 /NCGR_PEP_ID=MMETSP1141-20130122/19245_1 /TAXON_ID=483371 /ORGANISM="non described non described, Strain CCMP2298" /LENGTH=39 /DNA_ID= /DNA_START= /DNA_END= /DNA_ORIENTATION=
MVTTHTASNTKFRYMAREDTGHVQERMSRRGGRLEAKCD